ncbi:hypothetical protein [Clostridium sp. VAP52]|uniref:hypothetical protein n=1 Tax=Clostridium sp. VAP52 TaxID=2949977 RepID=UPI00207A883D|nr:hypothetical protein [Clostridium sp. VAP52]
MGINKNDCLDCANSINIGNLRHNWICTKGYQIPKDKNGIVEVLGSECEDFKYEE